MRFSPASNLSDRQTVWVGYRNDGSNPNIINAPVGRPATLWSAHFSEIFERDVVPINWG